MIVIATGQKIGEGGKLIDRAYFKTVHLLPGGIGIEWAEGQDIAPHELYELRVAQ